MKTVVCHFYNEEHLLPWWLNHHKHIFDHGIMIDYNSEDRSRDIIKEICPSWEIRPTRNENFDSIPVDQEVMDIEKVLDGWRMALNVTEFLYGNTDHLKDLPDPTQYLIGNYVFVDMDNPDQGQITLDHSLPLHQQRYWGYDDFSNTGISVGKGGMGRMHRSIHNYPVIYEGGRHFGKNVAKSFDDLVIFYYGYADSSEAGIKRKTQIQTKMSDSERGQNAGQHVTDANGFIDRTVERRQHSRDLRPELEVILAHNRRITGQEF